MRLALRDWLVRRSCVNVPLMTFLRCILVALAAALSTPAAAQTATFSTIETAATGYATFNSNNIKIAKHPLGTVVAYIVSQSTTGTAQRLKITFLGNDGSRATLLDAVLETNGACVEVSEAGEIFAGVGEATNARVFKWTDPGSTPTTATAPGGFAKWSCAWDETRRAFWIITQLGELLRFTDQPALASRTTIYAPWNDVHYHGMHVGEDGALHLFWNDAIASSYRGVHYMASPDGVSWLQSWAPQGAVGSALTLPVTPNENGTSLLISRAQDLAPFTLMLATYADRDIIAAAYTYVPEQNAHCFSAVQRCSNGMMVYDRLTGTRRAQHFPLRGRAIMPRSAGAGLAKRGDGLYYVATTGNEVLVLKLSADGVKVSDYARFPVPGLTGTTCLLSLTIARGHPDDTDILGLFTVLKASCADWASGAAEMADAEVRMVRISL